MQTAEQPRPQFGVTECNVWHSLYYARTDGEKGEVYDPQGFLLAVTPDPWNAEFIAEAMNEGAEDDSDDDGEDDEYDETLVDNLRFAASEILSELATVSGPFKALRQKARKLKDCLDAIAASEMEDE